MLLQILSIMKNSRNFNVVFSATIQQKMSWLFDAASRYSVTAEPQVVSACPRSESRPADRTDTFGIGAYIPQRLVDESFVTQRGGLTKFP